MPSVPPYLPVTSRNQTLRCTLPFETTSGTKILPHHHPDRETPRRNQHEQAEQLTHHTSACMVGGWLGASACPCLPIPTSLCGRGVCPYLALSPWMTPSTGNSPAIFWLLDRRSTPAPGEAAGPSAPDRGLLSERRRLVSGDWRRSMHACMHA